MVFIASAQHIGLLLVDHQFLIQVRIGREGQLCQRIERSRIHAVIGIGGAMVGDGDQG